MFNLVEMVSSPEEMEQAPCLYGNIVIGHACYCHNEESPYRKCPHWRSGERDYENCEYFETIKGEHASAEEVETEVKLDKAGEG